jgi:hypothetical protein
VRFIENHDETRSAVAFGDRVRAAAVLVTTIQGLHFFYQGQFEGRTDHLPVQLGRWIDEPANEDLRRFYDKLLAAAKDDVFHAGEWRLLDVHPAGDGPSRDLLAWRWVRGGDIRIVVVNLGGGAAEGLVHLASELPGGPGDDAVLFEDQLNEHQYPGSRKAINQSGLYVKLEKGGAHILRIVN